MSSYVEYTDNVVLVSSDGVKYTVTEEVANKFLTVKNALESSSRGEIPLLELNSEILAKIIKFTKYHIENPLKDDDNMTQWDVEFFKNESSLFDIIEAANYLEYKDLLNEACRGVANLIKGKSVDEIREYFGVKNDYSPEEIEQIQKENEWIEE